MRKILTILVGSLFFGSASNLFAQDTDEQLWLTAGAGIEVIDDLKVSFTQGLRLDQGISRIGKVYPELQLSYKVIKGFRVHAGYRFTADKRSEGDFRFEHRLFVGARYKYSFDDLSLSYRLEFQEDIYKKGGVGLNDHVLRNKLGAAYKVHKRVIPFAAFEYLYNLGSPDGAGSRNYRITVGTEFNLKKHGVEVFYRLRRSFESPASTDHIIGLGYNYDF